MEWASPLGSTTFAILFFSHCYGAGVLALWGTMVSPGLRQRRRFSPALLSPSPLHCLSPSALHLRVPAQPPAGGQS